jgi:hypothetical protein
LRREFNYRLEDTRQAEIKPTTLAPPSDREAAIVSSLPPGFYTAILRGLDGGTGIALLEVYNFQARSFALARSGGR